MAGFALDTHTKCDTTISHEFLGKIIGNFLYRINRDIYEWVIYSKDEKAQNAIIIKKRGVFK